jgi:hypothetical protein
MTKTSIFRFSAVERNISDADLIPKIQTLGKTKHGPNRTRA